MWKVETKKELIGSKSPKVDCILIHRHRNKLYESEKR